MLFVRNSLTVWKDKLELSYSFEDFRKYTCFRYNLELATLSRVGEGRALSKGLVDLCSTKALSQTSTARGRHALDESPEYTKTRQRAGL